MRAPGPPAAQGDLLNRPRALTPPSTDRSNSHRKDPRLDPETGFEKSPQLAEQGDGRWAPGPRSAGLGCGWRGTWAPGSAFRSRCQGAERGSGCPAPADTQPAIWGHHSRAENQMLSLPPPPAPAWPGPASPRPGSRAEAGGKGLCPRESVGFVTTQLCPPSTATDRKPSISPGKTCVV